MPPFQYDPNCVSITAGGLTLASTVSNPTAATWINAAIISSLQPIATYGYYAARVKASDVSMVSAFWLQGNYSEIDVEENVGASTINSPPPNKMMMNTHYFPNGFATDQNTHSEFLMPTGAADEYHTYSVWWKDPQNIVFYHNGVQAASVHLPNKFNEPMYLHFNTSAETVYGMPTIDSLNDPSMNTTYVQWVRSWQLLPQ